jgi:succinoglycan biosynthesis transport protein ExoP
MTTLPQTTALRLPRAGGQSHLALPANAPLAVAPAAGGSQLSMGDLWRIIRTNLWLMILMVAATGTGGYFLNGWLEKNHTVYQTKGILRIYPPMSSDPLHPTAMISDPNSMAIQQSTTVQLFKTDELINDALANDPENRIKNTNWWKVTCDGNIEKARERLAQDVSVTPEASPQLIDVTVRAATAEDTVTIANVLEEKAARKDQSFTQAKDQLDHEAVKTRLDASRSLVDFKTEEIRQLEANLTAKGADPGGVLSTRGMMFVKEVERQIQTRQIMDLADNELAAFNQSLNDGGTPTTVQAQLDQDHELLMLDATIQQMQAEADELGLFGASNPMVKEFGNRLARDEARRDKLREVKKAEFTRGELSQLELRLTHAKGEFESATKTVEQVRKENAELANMVNDLRAREGELQAARAKFQAAEDKEQDLNQLINRSQLGSMEWAGPPRRPDTRVSPNMSTTMAGAIAVGLFLSLGIAFLREVTDTSVRSPRDIARVGQLTLLGMVPHESDDPQSTGVRLPLVIFEAPHSIMAEQLRQVRTRLQHTASLDTTRTLLITSPNPGDGKTVIACNLAAGLALNGRRILLVDANFKRPEIHKIFGVGNEVGLSDALNDINTFSSAVRETAVPNLSVITSGPKPSNPTELLESQLLLDFIERALEEYDHVIFDSGPILFVSETVALAPRVDGVVSVVRARTSSRGVLARMRDSLRAVKAEHLGVVLNGVRSQAGGYYGRSIKTYYRYQNAD